MRCCCHWKRLLLRIIPSRTKTETPCDSDVRNAMLTAEHLPDAEMKALTQC
jgi:hypothetical protein